MKGQIILEGMDFYCHHGCLQQEHLLPGHFVVDFEGECEIGTAALIDSLRDTVDYSAIYEIIERRMQQGDDLLEHLCAGIVDELASAFPTLERFSVQVSKERPPVGGEVGWARVKIGFRR